MSKADKFYLKYTVPISLRKESKPCFQSLFRQVCTNEPGVDGLPSSIMNEACWKKYFRKLAFPTWLKKEM